MLGHARIRRRSSALLRSNVRTGRGGRKGGREKRARRERQARRRGDGHATTGGARSLAPLTQEQDGGGEVPLGAVVQDGRLLGEDRADVLVGQVHRATEDRHLVGEVAGGHPQRRGGLQRHLPQGLLVEAERVLQVEVGDVRGRRGPRAVDAVVAEGVLRVMGVGRRRRGRRPRAPGSSAAARREEGGRRRQRTPGEEAAGPRTRRAGKAQREGDGAPLPPRRPARRAVARRPSLSPLARASGLRRVPHACERDKRFAPGVCDRGESCACCDAAREDVSLVL